MADPNAAAAQISADADCTHSQSLLTVRSLPAHRTRRCKTWFFVEPVLIIYFFSEFPVDFIAQKYVLDWVRADKIHHDALLNITHPKNVTVSPCDPNITDSEYEFQESIQSFSSNFAVVGTIFAGVPATFMTVLLGASSDQYGRRYAVLPPLLGVVFTSLILTIIVHFQASIYFLFISNFLYGCCGSFTAMTMGCFSYVADRTAPERRMIRITILEMCMLVSGVVSPICLGPLLAVTGYTYVLFGVTIMSIMNLIYTFCTLPSKTGDEEKNLPDASKNTTSHENLADDEVHGRSRVSATDAASHLRSDEQNSILISSINSDALIVSHCDNHLSESSPVNSEHVVHSNHRNQPHPNEPNGTSDLLSDSDSNPSSVDLPASDSLMVVIISQLKTSIYLFVRQPAPEERTDQDGRSLGGACQNRRLKLNILLLAFFITTLPTFDFSLLTLFEMNSPLCWTVDLIGIYTGVSLGISTFGAMPLIPLLKCFLADHIIALVASAALVTMTVYKAFVRTTLMMFLGAVFGVIACVEVICYVIGTIIFNSIYSATVIFMTGFVFLVMAAFYFLGGVCLVIYAAVVSSERRSVRYERLNEPATQIS